MQLTSYSSIDNYGLFTKEPVEKAAQVKGMKIICAGPNALYIKAVGGVTVLSDLTQQYNNLKTGVADGTVIWPEATITFKLVEVAPYYLETDFGTGVNKSVTINKQVWEGLPDEVKTGAEGRRGRLPRQGRTGRDRSLRKVDQDLHRQGR